jgi:hypothetical protein
VIDSVAVIGIVVELPDETGVKVMACAAVMVAIAGGTTGRPVSVVGVPAIPVCAPTGSSMKAIARIATSAVPAANRTCTYPLTDGFSLMISSAHDSQCMTAAHYTTHNRVRSSRLPQVSV